MNRLPMLRMVAFAVLINVHLARLGVKFECHRCGGISTGGWCMSPICDGCYPVFLGSLSFENAT